MLENVLEKNTNSFSNVFDFDLSTEKVYKFDFSIDNEELEVLDLTDTDVLNFYVNSKLQDYKCKYGIGGYLENRIIYKRSNHFGNGAEARSIHLGIDVWCDAGSSIYAFMDSKVHSFRNNDNFGDYGPTIILEHQLNDMLFYTLYGHLSKSSLDNLSVGDKIKKGDKFAQIGDDSENGNWPPHLHFQLITDMLNKKGDFFGVCKPSEKEYFSKICPNPEIILLHG